MDISGLGMTLTNTKQGHNEAPTKHLPWKLRPPSKPTTASKAGEWNSSAIASKIDVQIVSLNACFDICLRHERNETHECCLQKRIQSATGLIWTTFETILISGGRAARRYHSQLGLWHHRYDCGACVLLPTCNTALYE